MPRPLRVASGGHASHVLNRAVGKSRIFSKQRDFEAFEEKIAETLGIQAVATTPRHGS